MEVFGLGLDYGKVQLCDSDPHWPDSFEWLAEGLRTALGVLAVAVEHVGSTSVPGLAAKPILDVAVGLAPQVGTEDVVSALETAGYIFRGDKGEHGGLLFVLENRPAHRVAHVHVVAHGDAQWCRWLSFRDLLRADPTIRAEYDKLKRELADRHRDDRQAYTAAKTAFIAGLRIDDGAMPG
jgi:GrpB-like predicted nucleotidyltransferase (UPF0157 family)